MTGATETEFVVCLRNEGFEASLSIRKLYRVLPDPRSQTQALIRVIDETGQDYLYPKQNFAPVEVTRETAAALSTA